MNLTPSVRCGILGTSRASGFLFVIRKLLSTARALDKRDKQGRGQLSGYGGDMMTDKEKKNGKKYRETHKDYERERKRKWSAGLTEERRKEISRKKWQNCVKAHGEHERERKLKWRIENRDKDRLWHKEWHKAHPDKNRTYLSNHRNRKRGAGGKYTDADVQRMMGGQKNKCYYCGKSLRNGYHVDHVKPIARGGSNHPSNLVLACPGCNMSKAARLLHEWMEGGHLL